MWITILALPIFARRKMDFTFEWLFWIIYYHENLVAQLS